MKVRTPDGEVHDLSPTDAVRLIHTSGAVPVVDEPKVEKRPASTEAVETRPPKKK
jgi:hypothetical protein